MPSSPRSDRQGGFWPQWEDNRLFTVLLGILLVYLIVFTFAKIVETFAAAERVGFADNIAPTITVYGEGTASAAPDTAIIDMGVVVRSTSTDAAQTSNAEKTNALLAALRTAGVDEADIKTTNYSVYPVYNYDVAPPAIVAYEASQTVTVTVRDTDRTGDILSLATAQGATMIGDVRNEIDDDASLRDEARREAIRDAYEEAAMIASAMGEELGDVVSYYESDGGIIPYYDYAERSMAMDAGAVSPDIAEGENDITVNVTITYALE